LTVRGLSAWAKKQFKKAREELEDASPTEVESIVAQAEEKVKGLRPTLAKGIVWANPSKKLPTDVVVVFIHGWSGSRLEISPLCEMIASKLGANCYFARLPGHGIEMMGYGQEEDVTCLGYAYEGVHALAIAEKLGKKILLVGISTGAALAAWLCCQPWSRNLCGCICISTNVWVKPPALVRFAGRIPLLREFIMFLVRGGLTTRNKILNKAHGELITSPYPTHLTPSIFDLSSALALADPRKFAVPLLAFHNPDDPTCCFKEADRFVSAVGNSKMVTVTPLENEHKHIITGNALTPSTLPLFLDEIGTWCSSLQK